MTVYRPQPIRAELLRTLAKTDPPDKPREIRDRQAHLVLRHQPSGYLALYVELKRGKRERICDARRILDQSDPLTLQAVRNEAQRIRGQHVEGRDFSAERSAERSTPTLKTYLRDTYGPWLKANRRSGAETLRKLEGIAKSLGNRKLTEITPAGVESWRIKRQKNVSAETVNKDLSALHAALSRAVKLEIIPRNPLTGYEKREIDRHRRVVRALTAAEKSQLIAALEARDENKRERRANGNRWREARGYDLLPPLGRFADVLTPAVVVSLETGLRRGELFGLEWPSIDFHEKTLRVEGTTAKTFETRDVPLTDLAHTTLRDWWLQRGQPGRGYVFTIDDGRLGSLKKSYYATLKAAGIERVNRRGERVNWHSLRHTFGSLLGAAGADSTTLMKLMGHANLETTQRYLHTDKERKRAAVDLLREAL